MDRTERFHKIVELLNRGRPVPKAVFLDELEVSLATLKRDLAYMRDRMSAPIVYSARDGGYLFERARRGAPAFALPGLWFNQSEIHALLTMQQLLAGLQPGLLEPHVGPLLERLKALLATGDHSSAEVQRRVRILHMGSRHLNLRYFQVVAAGVLRRRRIHIVHFNRQNGATVARNISPQRLTHYRDNWYVDAWCHLREAMRSFAVDAIAAARLLPARATDVPATDLDDYFKGSYGIFAGQPTARAVLRFSPERARWVSREIWHSRQQARWEPDRHYVLEVPYSDHRELLMDILKYGADVEVLAPEALRAAVRNEVERLAARYGRP
jgi:predicted DNA-binding transcriptional regulator YafY